MRKTMYITDKPIPYRLIKKNHWTSEDLLSENTILEECTYLVLM